MQSNADGNEADILEQAMDMDGLRPRPCVMCNVQTPFRGTLILADPVEFGVGAAPEGHSRAIMFAICRECYDKAPDPYGVLTTRLRELAAAGEIPSIAAAEFAGSFLRNN